MEPPLISIVLPFYNAQATLARALESIRRQDFTAFEVLAFDDGSVDESAEIVRAYAAQDPRIRVLESEHVGIVAALQDACAAAQGDYLARMDADDVAQPERLSTQLRLLQQDKHAGLCGSRVRMTGDAIGPGRRRYEAWMNGLLSSEEISRELFIECPLAHPTFMMSRAIYHELGGYQERGWPEDYDLVMRVWEAGYRLLKCPQYLLDWEDGPGRLSMTDPRYEESAFRALKRHYLLRSYLKKQPRFFQWGAGEVGKRWLREWGEIRPEAVVDINPRKIGRDIHGVRVIAPEDLPLAGQAFVLIAVGAPGARAEIRDWMTAYGYEECRDYLFLA